MIVLDTPLMKRIAAHEAAEWLILDEHPDYPGQWIVESLEQGFLIDFIDLIGPYRAVGPVMLQRFLARAEEKGYKVCFTEQPLSILDANKALNDPPSIRLHSQLENTQDGFLPYQLQGYNYLKDLEAGVAMWSTGTGKTVLASALLKYHLQKGDFDFAWFVVKSHNKVNTQRALVGLTDIDSVVLDGPQKRRQETIAGLMEDPTVPKVIITNYEKFRIDLVHLLPLFERRVLLIWDEMPSKLKNRKTALYKAVRKLLYRKVNLSDPRPVSLRQYMLSATPIENDPDDFFNCVRLLDPAIYGGINDFHDEFVASYSFYQPESWRDLDRMGLKAAHITHQVDKTSPDIAEQFPKVIETPLYIDWHPDDREVYDQLLVEARKMETLPAITVMQMLCDAPSMVSNSASLRRAYKDAVNYSEDLPGTTGSEAAFALQEGFTRSLTDDTHSKLQTLRQLITEDHKNEKIIVFSAFNDALLPILERKFLEWNVSHVRYDGTSDQKQAAQELFQYEDWVQVFLSSDQGADSLSLEQASVVIHYDLPWKWATYTQRQNRAHRITSEYSSVRFYSLLMVDSVEDRKREVLQRKQGYHQAVFEGVTERNEASRLSREDLLYILG
jgi:SNF2 family DNA or RNA helicase